MTTEIEKIQDVTSNRNDLVLAQLPQAENKDKASRLAKFSTWLKNSQGISVLNDDVFTQYRDWMVNGGLSGVSISAHLSTVRGAIRPLLKSNQFRDALYNLVDPEITTSPAEQVTEFLTRLGNALDPDKAPVKVTKKQDVSDGEHLRLTRQQAENLLNAPGLTPLKALRDTAIIAVLLCTGIREAELCDLEVIDLRQHLNGELALHVRSGKGDKARLVPYGELSFCLPIVDRYLSAAGIAEGLVFRGLYKGGRVRANGLTTRAVEMILENYPIMINGEMRTVTPHDLRRTYAARLYEGGLKLLAIQQNLGHASSITTEGYIGDLDAKERAAAGVYTFDLAKLAGAA